MIPDPSTINNIYNLLAFLVLLFFGLIIWLFKNARDEKETVQRKYDKLQNSTIKNLKAKLEKRY